MDANTCITERTSGPKQQRDAQSELDDPKFRQQLVRDLKVLFNGDFEEESTQQLQDILDHVRSNQTIAMASADEHTQVSHLLTIVTKLTSVFQAFNIQGNKAEHHSKGMSPKRFIFIYFTKHFQLKQQDLPSQLRH
jgi:hypothetical protein